MANAAQIYNIETLSSYLGEGGEKAVRAIVAALTREAKSSDNIKVVAATLAHTITVADASTGAYPLGVIAQSQGTACTVCIYAADDATVGTTDSHALMVSGTSGELTWAVIGGAGNYRLFATDGSGIGWAAPATTQGTGTVANDPNCWLIYVDA